MTTSPFFPPVFVSDVDVTNPAAGIHCGRVDDQYGRLAVGIARRLVRLVE